jgi:hypothetical protein
MPPFADLFALPRPAPGFERRLVGALRLWVLMARGGRSARPALTPLLGDATSPFLHLMESVVSAWPDPFSTFPPCAEALTPDEATVLALITRASANRPEACDALLGEFLGADERARLWRAASRLGEMLPALP